MFERFTDGARRVIVLAQEEARRLDHNCIGTEHLVLGLMADPVGGVRAVAEMLEFTLESCRAEVEARSGRGDGAPRSHIPFTPGAKKALEMSLREALTLGHNFIATEHIMLGVLRQEDELGAQLLLSGGTPLEQLRQALVEVIAEERRSLGDRAPTPQPVATLGCHHPEGALRWEPAQVAGLGISRSMIVVRCSGCGVAITVMADPAADADPVTDE